MRKMPVQEQLVIEGWRGVLVDAGLGTPSKRGLTAFLATAAVAYAFKLPKGAFREDGTMRPAADGNGHFLLTPLTVGAIAFLFT